MTSSGLHSALSFFGKKFTPSHGIFLAGIITALLSSLLISKAQVVLGWLQKTLRTAAKKFLTCWNTRTRAAKDEHDDHEWPDPFSTRISRRPFEFRERLWHEPPELDYSNYELYIEVQKDIKDRGVNLERETDWLGLEMEKELLADAQRWAHKQTQVFPGDTQLDSFYEGLYRELCTDAVAVVRESSSKFNLYRDDRDWHTMAHVQFLTRRARERRNLKAAALRRTMEDH